MRKATPLKLAIVQSGIPQKDIAAGVGIDPAHLSRIVNGLHADDHTKQSIAREIQRRTGEPTTVADLFDGPAVADRSAA